MVGYLPNRLSDDFQGPDNGKSGFFVFLKYPQAEITRQLQEYRAAEKAAP